MDGGKEFVVQGRCPTTCLKTKAIPPLREKDWLSLILGQWDVRHGGEQSVLLGEIMEEARRYGACYRKRPWWWLSGAPSVAMPRRPLVPFVAPWNVCLVDCTQTMICIHLPTSRTMSTTSRRPSRTTPSEPPRIAMKKRTRVSEPQTEMQHIHTLNRHWSLS